MTFSIYNGYLRFDLEDSLVYASRVSFALSSSVYVLLSLSSPYSVSNIKPDKNGTPVFDQTEKGSACHPAGIGTEKRTERSSGSSQSESG